MHFKQPRGFATAGVGGVARSTIPVVDAACEPFQTQVRIRSVKPVFPPMVCSYSTPACPRRVPGVCLTTQCGGHREAANGDAEPCSAAPDRNQVPARYFDRAHGQRRRVGV